MLKDLILHLGLLQTNNKQLGSLYLQMFDLFGIKHLLQQTYETDLTEASFRSSMNW